MAHSLQSLSPGEGTTLAVAVGLEAGLGLLRRSVPCATWLR